MPNPTRVKCFIELCKQENYTRAAEKLYISQPALSRHISLLEQELGVRLIRRNRKRFQLTPEGSAFLKLAKEFHLQEEAFELASQNLKTNINSVMRLGFYADFPISRILFLESEMKRLLPDLRIDFRAYHNQTHILPELIAGNLDAAIAFRSELGNLPRLSLETIATNYIAIIISDKHRLWGHKSVSPEDLRNEILYIPIQEVFPVSFMATVNFMQQYDILISGSGYDNNIEEQLLRVRDGDCISLSHMYGSELINSFPDTYARIPIRNSDIKYGDITLAYHDETPEISTLISCLHTAFPPVEID